MKNSGSIMPCEAFGMNTLTTANLLSIGPQLVNLLETHFVLFSRASSFTSVSALATGKLKNSGSATTIAGCVPSDIKMMIPHPESENDVTGSLHQTKMKTPSTERRARGRTRGSPRQLFQILSSPMLMSFMQGQNPIKHLQVL